MDDEDDDEEMDEGEEDDDDDVCSLFPISMTKADLSRLLSRMMVEILCESN
jgi:hypothetical protein